jgi:hypothetical protein
MIAVDFLVNEFHPLEERLFWNGGECSLERLFREEEPSRG